jgi:hypothetical protein
MVFFEGNRSAPISRQSSPSYQRNDKTRNGKNDNHHIYDNGTRNKKNRERGDRYTNLCKEGEIAKE